MKFTRHNLKKLETLFQEMDYTVRYERGSFNSGYAIVEDRKIVVINKFYDAEGRINVLLEILNTLQVEPKRFTESTVKFYKQVQKLLNLEEEE